MIKDVVCFEYIEQKLISALSSAGNKWGADLGKLLGDSRLQLASRKLGTS